MTNRSSLIILIPLLVLALAAYYFLVWTPLQEDIAHAREEASIAEAELEHARRMQTNKEEMKSEIADIKAALETMDKQILEAPYQPELLIYLQDAETANQVDIARINYGPVQQMSGDENPELGELHAVDIGLGFSGSFQQVVNFVTEIEEGSWFSASGGFDFYDTEGGIDGMYTFRIFYWSEIMDPIHPELPTFPATGRQEPFSP